MLLWHANYHPDGGQLFFPLDAEPFYVPLALPGDDVTPERFVCFRFDGSQGLYIHPDIWHGACSALAGKRRFFDKQGAVHARVSVDFAREFGCLLEALDSRADDQPRRSSDDQQRRLRLPPLRRRVRRRRHRVPRVADDEPVAEPGRGAAPAALRPLVRPVRPDARGGGPAARLPVREGSAFYFGNPFFNAKMALFVLVGLVSIYPTVRFIKWRAQMREGGAPTVSAGEHRWILWSCAPSSCCCSAPRSAPA